MDCGYPDILPVRSSLFALRSSSFARFHCTSVPCFVVEMTLRRLDTRSGNVLRHACCVSILVRRRILRGGARSAAHDDPVDPRPLEVDDVPQKDWRIRFLEACLVQAPGPPRPTGVERFAQTNRALFRKTTSAQLAACARCYDTQALCKRWIPDRTRARIIQ